MNDSHLTPEKLLGNNILPRTWTAAQTAFICFTPFPNGFTQFRKESASERYFLHSPNNEVCLCSYKNIPFLVISEVYGFPVGATTVEELVHHGIRNIIGIGFAGAFDGLPVGRTFIAKATMSDLPLAAHYGVEEFIRCSPHQSLMNEIESCFLKKDHPYENLIVWNSNSLYRESPALIQSMKEKGCQAVNMDVLSIYSVAPVCGREANLSVKYAYVGTVTDSEEGMSPEDVPAEWDSDLAVAVSGEKPHAHDLLIQLMVENLLPSLHSK